MSSFAQESFSGIAVIKSYNLQTQSVTDFNELATESYSKNMDLVRVQAWFFPLMILLIGCSNLIVIFVGGNQYINGKIVFQIKQSIQEKEFMIFKEQDIFCY